jgi:hypothetical protein
VKSAKPRIVYVRKFNNQTTYKRRKPKLQEDFDKLEAAEKKRRNRMHHPMRYCSTPCIRPKQAMVKVNGIGHKLPCTWGERFAWEFAQARLRGATLGAGAIAVARTAQSFGYFPSRAWSL